MSNIEQYYNNTENSEPMPNVKYFINLKVKPGKAIDLGCGAGRDTVYLIRNGWNVTAIDANNTSERIKSKLNGEEQIRFKFKKQEFEELKLSKCNLIVANNSLSFCNPQHFNEMWKEIVNSIESTGYFVGNFFGIHDEWNVLNLKKPMTFLSKEHVEELFSNFEIISLKEVEKDGKTGLGRDKHWHFIIVIAKKKR